MNRAKAAELLKRRGLVPLAVLYALVFEIVYWRYLYAEYGYRSYYDFDSRPVWAQLGSLALAAVPVLFYRGFKKVSSHVAMLIYVVCYVPTIVMLLFGLDRGAAEVMGLQAVFALGMSALFLADRLEIRRPRGAARKTIPAAYLHAFTLACTLVVVAAYAGHMRLVSFADVYTQRFAARDLHPPFYVGYAMMGLAGCVYPVYVAVGLARRKIAYALAGCAGYVLIYACTASKLSLFTPLLLAAVYAGLRIGKKRVFVLALVGLTAVSVALLYVPTHTNSLTLWTKSLFFSRILGDSALANTVYYDFFSRHPRTHYTHIGVVKRVTKAYPYGDLDVGQVVGRDYFQNEDSNFNANFWATDGIAAAGIPGLLAISVVVALFFAFMNAVLRGGDLVLSSLALTSFAMSLVNISLFTSLLSGGGFLLLLILRYVRLDGRRPAVAAPAAGEAGGDGAARPLAGRP